MTCKLFEGFKDRDGYGQKWHDGKVWRAHRWAYTQAHGPIPKGQLVRHLCHNPGCINVDHLVLGTQQDNMDDMKRAERQTRGETNGNVKLTEAQAREIYDQKYPGKVPDGYTQDLANKYGVSGQTIRDIWRKNSWKHIHEQT